MIFCCQFQQVCLFLYGSVDTVGKDRNGHFTIPKSKYLFQLETHCSSFLYGFALKDTLEINLFQLHHGALVGEYTKTSPNTSITCTHVQAKQQRPKFQQHKL